MLAVGQRRPADRRPRRDGRRRRADHARDAVDHHERLPARGARQGDRHLGRHGRDRHRPRPARRRPAARVLRLDVGLPAQRPGRGARPPARRLARPREPRPATRARSTSSAPGSPSRRSSRSSTAIIEAPERGWTDPLMLALLRRSLPCSAPRSCAGSCAPPSRCSTCRSSATRASASARSRISIAFFALFGAIFATDAVPPGRAGLLARCEAGAAMMPLAFGLVHRRRIEHRSWSRGSAPPGSSPPASPGSAGCSPTTLAWSPTCRTGRSGCGSSASRCRWAGSWRRRPTRSWAPCPRRRRASARR